MTVNKKAQQAHDQNMAQEKGMRMGRWLALGEIIYYINNTETDLQKVLVYLNKEHRKLTQELK